MEISGVDVVSLNNEEMASASREGRSSEISLRRSSLDMVVLRGVDEERVDVGDFSLLVFMACLCRVKNIAHPATAVPSTMIITVFVFMVTESVWTIVYR
jgi:hypothetical protein